MIVFDTNNCYQKLAKAKITQCSIIEPLKHTLRTNDQGTVVRGRIFCLNCDAFLA